MTGRCHQLHQSCRTVFTLRGTLAAGAGSRAARHALSRQHTRHQFAELCIVLRWNRKQEPDIGGNRERVDAGRLADSLELAKRLGAIFHMLDHVIGKDHVELAVLERGVGNTALFKAGVVHGFDFVAGVNIRGHDVSEGLQ